MSRQVGISTAVIIVSFLVLGTLIGPIIGAFLAVPATVVASVVLDELAEKSPSLGFGEEVEATQEPKAKP
jgi:predicted PurR-regulated permease PerM